MNRWRQIESLFQEALQRPAGERDIWLREACATDAELHREVASLLANHHASAVAGPWAAAAAQLIVKPVQLEPGQYVGPYQIISFLAAGGMGEVYRARDTKLKRDIAIKILPDEFSRDADRVSRFLREAEVLASLNHPNIGAIYDLEEVNGARFLVLELIEGETLAERIARGPIPIDEALAIAKQIVDALEAAHERGIVHRDLKPANVKITPDGKVKVLDFGLAKVFETQSPSATRSNSPTMLSGTMGGMIVGTAAYMSPEQARGQPADQRSDVFAFGCVLFEMLAGQQAFQGEDISDVLAAVIKGDVNFNSLPSNLSPRLYELLRRSLAKNRRERMQAIGDVRFELDAITADPHGLKLQPKREIEQQSLWKRGVSFAATAILAAALTLAITFVLMDRRPVPVVGEFLKSRGDRRLIQSATVLLPPVREFSGAPACGS